MINPLELNAFLDHTEKLIVGAASKIFNGDVKLWPYKQGQTTGMQFTPYKSIMNFDPILSENQYRLVDNESVKEILKKLGEEQSDGI